MNFLTLPLTKPVCFRYENRNMTRRTPKTAGQASLTFHVAFSSTQLGRAMARRTSKRAQSVRYMLPRRHSEAQRPALSGARAEPERREGPGVALFAPSGPPDSARKRLGPFGSEPNRPLRAAQGMPAGAPGTARGAWRAIRPGVSLREAAPEGTPPPASGSPAPSWDARSGGPARP